MTTTVINFKTNPGQLEKAHKARNALGMGESNHYRRAGMPKVANLELPQEVVDNFQMLKDNGLKSLRNDYVVALVKAGWSMTSISNALGLSNQMVSYIMKTHTAEEVPVTLTIPEVPKHPEAVTPQRYALPSPELLEKLLKLQPFAQKVRSNSPNYRTESEEYSRLINYAHTVEKVTLYRLGKLLGVTTSALAFRLVRYGYKTTELGKSKVYRQIRAENRPK
jgi:lambda repressor-like predicted transcriptional regulator